MTDRTAHPPLYPPGRVLALTGVVGLIGLVTHAAAVGQGWTFPSLGYAAGIGVWKLATLGVLAAALWRFERQPLSATALGLGPGLSPDERRRRRRRALLGLGGAAELLGALSLAPGLGLSPVDPAAYGATRPIGWAVLLVQVLVVYPLTVLAEEAFFRGFLQPRLSLAPPVLSGVLWAAHHLQQAATIPWLVPLGLALGVLRWRRGDIRASGAVHDLGDVLFLVTACPVVQGCER